MTSDECRKGPRQRNIRHSSFDLALDFGGNDGDDRGPRLPCLLLDLRSAQDHGLAVADCKRGAYPDVLEDRLLFAHAYRNGEIDSKVIGANLALSLVCGYYCGSPAGENESLQLMTF